MNVLILICYENKDSKYKDISSSNRNIKKNSSEFCSIVKELFKCAFKELNFIDTINYEYRNIDDIDNYLYEKCSIYNQTSNLDNFNKIDFIIADGIEKSNLPWDKYGYKLAILVKMCMKFNKAMFFFSIGLQIIIYLIATHFLLNINVINNKIEIASLEEIHMIDSLFLKNLKSNDLFLDYVTGDMYSFRSESLEWIPKLNIGLHNKYIAEKFKKTRGKYIIPSNIHRPNTSIDNNTKNFLSLNNNNLNNKNILNINIKGDSNVVIGLEKQCYINKLFKTHYIFNNFNNQLLCLNSSEWNVHYFDIIDKNYAFNVLLENNNGPCLIEYKSCFGANFKLKKQTNDVVKLLYNFIKKEIDSIYKDHKDKNAISLESLKKNNFKNINISSISKTDNYILETKLFNGENKNYQNIRKTNNSISKRPVSSITCKKLNKHEKTTSYREKLLNNISINKNKVNFISNDNTTNINKSNRPQSTITYRIDTGNKNDSQLLKGTVIKKNLSKVNSINSIINNKRPLTSKSKFNKSFTSEINNSNESIYNYNEEEDIDDIKAETFKVLTKRDINGVVQKTTTNFKTLTNFYRDAITSKHKSMIEQNDSPDKYKNKENSYSIKTINDNKTNCKYLKSKDKLLKSQYKNYDIDPIKLNCLSKKCFQFNQKFFNQDDLNNLFFESDGMFNNFQYNNKINEKKMLVYYKSILKNKADIIKKEEEIRSKNENKKLYKLTNTKELYDKKKKVNYEEKFNELNKRLTSSKLFSGFLNNSQEETHKEEYKHEPNINSDENICSIVKDISTFNMLYPYVNTKNFPKGKKILFAGQTKDERRKLNEYIDLLNRNTNNNDNPFVGQYITYSKYNKNAIVLNQFKSMQSILSKNKVLKHNKQEIREKNNIKAIKTRGNSAKYFNYLSNRNKKFEEAKLKYLKLNSNIPNIYRPKSNYFIGTNKENWLEKKGFTTVFSKANN